MNTAKVFTIEFFICVGIISWSNIKKGNVPWPGGIIASGIGIVIISMSAIIDEKLAALLGAGFLLAALMNVLSDNGKLTAVLDPPPTGTYDILTFGGGGGTTTNPSGGGTTAPNTGIPADAVGTPAASSF